MPQDPCLALLRELVSIDSINPSLVPGARGEGEIAEFVANHMRGLGMDVEIEEVAPGRPNVVGILEGRARGASLMLCGHVDTVGVEGMTAPFDPVERDGRIFGRGAQDMKGGVAAMIDAARVAASHGLPRGRIVVAAVVDEEYASIGADALVQRWRSDMAVVTEPTDLRIGVAHKGFTWIDVESRGRAAHGSRPKDGRDAILRMGRVLGGLEALDRELQARQPHPLMGTGSLHASIISGGQELSSYPARCVLQLERRTLAGETAEHANDEVSAILAKLARDDPEFDAECRVTFSRPAYEIAKDHPLPPMLGGIVRSMGAAGGEVGMSFWTDAAILGDAGIPTVLFGPGGAGLHGREEYVNAEDVKMCRDALAALIQQAL